MEPALKQELEETLKQMVSLRNTFAAASIGMSVSYSAFSSLMDVHIQLCRGLLDQGIDFTTLKKEDSPAFFLTPEMYSSLNEQVALLFPGHALVSVAIPRDLKSSLCPICRRPSKTNLVFPAYMIRCETVTCPKMPARLVLPTLNLVIPVKTA